VYHGHREFTLATVGTEFVFLRYLVGSPHKIFLRMIGESATAPPLMRRAPGFAELPVAAMILVPNYKVYGESL